MDGRYSEKEIEEWRKKRQEALDKLNSDPQALLAWIQRVGRLHEERKKEGPTFLRKYASATMIMDALLANTQGLTIAEMRDLFGPGRDDSGLGDHIRVALNILKERGFAQKALEQTGEGSAERWIAIAQNTT